VKRGDHREEHLIEILMEFEKLRESVPLAWEIHRFWRCYLTQGNHTALSAKLITEAKEKAIINFV
jgi:hypothetical protein